MKWYRMRYIDPVLKALHSHMMNPTGIPTGKICITHEIQYLQVILWPEKKIYGGSFAYHIQLLRVQRVDHDSYLMHFEN